MSEMTEAPPPAPLPIIGVLASKKSYGTEDIDQPTQPLLGARFEDAFKTQWPTDAHFVMYGLRGGGPFPRMRKMALDQLRERGGELEMHSVVIDYDNPNATDENGNPLLDENGQKYHKPWTDEMVRDFQHHLFNVVIPRAPWVGAALTGFYFTRGGARFVYVLRNPIIVDRGEAVHKAVVVMLAQAGLTWQGGAVDTKCSDWTRLMRLPHVTRGGKINKPLDEYWNLTARLDPSTLLGPGCASMPVVRTMSKPLKLPQPTHQRIHELVGDKENLPEWLKQASRDLKGRQCWTTIFDFRELAPNGARNDSIQSMAGEVVSLLHRYQRTNQFHVEPECAFALLYRGLVQLEQDDDWLRVGWEAICRYWAEEDAVQETRAAVRAIDTVQAGSIVDTIVRNMRHWSKVPELHHDDSTAATYATKKLIAATPAGYYVMNRQGFYDARGVSSARLVPLIKELGMESVMPLGYETKKEAWKPYTPQNLIDRHATIVNEVEGVSCGDGNWVRGLGGPEATMVLKLYSRRTDIRGEFSKDVDDWLRAIGGTPEGYEKLKRWIGYALAFDEAPMAALAITGCPGFGKKLLVNGLGETITSLRTVDAQEGSGFQSALLRSPYFIANEGFPVGQAKGYSPADTFRRLTGGDVVKAEKKFKDVIDIRVPIRVVLCANNLDIVRAVAGRSGELSVDDKHAIAQRLVHLRVPPRAAVWLEAMGGLEFTRGWIQGDGGQASRDVVAKHFLYLYENRLKVPRGQRFMMMGDLDARMLQGFNTQVGSNPVILEAVAAILERLASPGAAVNGAVLVREEGRAHEYWVTEHGVMSWLKTQGDRAADRLQPMAVRGALRGNLHPGSPEDGERRMFVTARGEEEARWFRVNMREIVEEAIERGWPHQSSKDLLKESDSRMGQMIRFPVGG